jgi:hypothetical protein
MKIFAGIAIIALGVFCILHFRHGSAPSAQDVEPVLRAYLASPDAIDCAGTVTIDRLDGIRVGEYSKELGGWPVYAQHSETCHAGGQETTSNGFQDPQREVAAAMVRRSAGGSVEAFVPAILQQGKREMQQSLQKAFDNIQVNK